MSKFFEDLFQYYRDCLLCEDGNPICVHKREQVPCAECVFEKECLRTVCRKMNPGFKSGEVMTDYDEPGCACDQLRLILESPVSMMDWDGVPQRKSEIVDFIENKFSNRGKERNAQYEELWQSIRRTVFALIDYTLLRRRDDLPPRERDTVPDFKEICAEYGWDYVGAEYLIPGVSPERIALLRGEKVQRRMTGKRHATGISVDRTRLGAGLVEGFTHMEEVAVAMESRDGWSITELGRMAVLLMLGGAVRETSFKKWFPEFLACVGREGEAPASCNKSSYKFDKTDSAFWRQFPYLVRKVSDLDRVTYRTDCILSDKAGS